MARKCRFLYENIFAQAGTLTASTEAAGFDAENVNSWRTYDAWKPTATGDSTLTWEGTSKAANCFGIFGYDDLVAAGGSYHLEYWNGSAWQDVSPAVNVSPTTSPPRMHFFDQVFATKWRLTINSNPVSSVAVLALGMAFEMEHNLWQGFTPPNWARTAELTVNVSDRGTYLNSSVVQRGFETSANFEHVSPDFITATWLPFVRHAETKPFFFAWNYDEFPEHIAFAQARNPIAPPVPQGYNRCSINFAMTGQIEGAHT